MKPVASVGDLSAIPWGALGSRGECASVTLRGKLLAVVDSGMGALNAPVCMDIGPSGSQRELQAERWLVRVCVWKLCPLEGIEVGGTTSVSAGSQASPRR